MNDKTITAPVHDSLRDLIGQAISDEIAAGAEQPDWCDSREIDRLADAVLAVLTAASGEPFMHAIMGPDGTAHIDENCVSASADSTALHIEVNCLNDSPDAGYSIVPVYLVAPQQHAQAALSDEQIIEIATATRSAEPNKDGGYILPFSFARAIEAAIIATYQPAPVAAAVAQGYVLNQQSAPTAQQERAWYKDWLAGLDGNITVDQIEFGRRVWAERARRAAEGGAR